MAKFSSSFDDLLASGRRQFDELTGKRPAQPKTPGSVVRQPEPASRDGGGTVIEGKARGIAFRLTAKRTTR